MTRNLVLAILISMVTVTTGCPAQCTCNSAQKIVSCTDPSLSSWPAGLPADTNTLKIKGSYSHRLPLRHIGAGDLNGLPELETLIISETELTSIDGNAFQNVPALRSLDLSFNKLTRLEPGVFHGLENLTFIYLTGNEHCSLPSSVFQGLKSLRELYLASMGISIFDTALFSGLPSLVHLDLSNNEIQELPKSATGPTFLPNLRNLDLSFNQLTTLSNDTGQLLQRVIKVELADNPWRCNCELGWLQGHKRHISPQHQSSNVLLCDSPAPLRYRALATIPSSELKCTPPTIVKCDQLAPVYVGDTFTVSCNMSGDPFPDVSWKTADGATTTGTSPGQPPSTQITVLEPIVKINFKATLGMNGDLTVMAQNREGVAEKKIPVVVKQSTTTTTTTTTPAPTTTGQAATEAPECSGNSMMLFVAAGIAGVSLLVSAIVVGVACKKMNNNKVEPTESERMAENNNNNNNNVSKKLDDDPDDYYGYGVEEINYGRVKLHDAGGPRPPTVAPRPLSAWDV